MGLALDPKLTYSTHIHNISVQAHKPLQLIKKHSQQQDGVNRREHRSIYRTNPVRHTHLHKT